MLIVSTAFEIRGLYFNEEDEAFKQARVKLKLLCEELTAIDFDDLWSDIRLIRKGKREKPTVTEQYFLFDVVVRTVEK